MTDEALDTLRTVLGPLTHQGSAMKALPRTKQEVVWTLRHLDMLHNEADMIEKTLPDFRLSGTDDGLVWIEWAADGRRERLIDFKAKD